MNHSILEKNTIYYQNKKLSSKEIMLQLNFRYSTAEKEGVYIEGDMIKVDKSFIEFAQKLNSYYEKFKSKWVTIIGTRKETKINQDFDFED